MATSSGPDVLRETAGELPPLLRAQPFLFAVPSFLLAGGVLLDSWVSPVHALAPALVGLVKGIGWGFYFRAAMRAAGGVQTSGWMTAVVAMSLSFVAYEYGDLGLIVPIVVWLLPVVDFALMYGDGPDRALAGISETIRAAPLLWFGTMLVLITALLMVGLVLSLPMSMFLATAHRDGEWFATLVGGALLGPFVHAAVVYRGRLLLAIHGDPE